jgi:hypothetical protein
MSAEGFREQVAEEDSWAQEGRGNRGMRRLQNEELYALYSSNIIRVINSRTLRWAGHVARMEERCIQGFGGKPEGRRTLERPRRRWKDNIKIDVKEVGWGTWTGSLWLRIETSSEFLCMR